jgi:hypothetical protein
MPGSSRAIVRDAEERFPIGIVLRVPEGGIGTRYTRLTEWLDDNCGIRDWSITPAGTRGVLNDAIAVYMSGPACAVAFVARWCMTGDPPGFYELRQDEPERRVPTVRHKSPP